MAESSKPSMEYLRNAAHPRGEFGRSVLESMNEHHEKLADWAFSHVELSPDARCLDVGCGGGANLARLLVACPQGSAAGVDVSETAIALSAERNAGAVEAGRLELAVAAAERLPFEAESFDFASACETIYFWPDRAAGLREVRRVLAPGGTFLIICEMSDPHDERFAEADFIDVPLPREMRDLALACGFSSAELHEREGWYCVVAKA